MEKDVRKVPNRDAPPPLCECIAVSFMLDLIDKVRPIIRTCLQPCLLDTWDRRQMGLVQTTWAVNAFKLIDTTVALHALLDRTLHLGMSKSTLLIGPLHQARIALLHALNRLDHKRNERSPSYALVHLSGIIHNSDLLALKAMARQLKIDFECELDPKMPASFQANMEFVLRALRGGSLINQPIIMVLQEFEIFARKPKHGLLYHLLDLAHNAANQIAIIAITEHSDAISLLETRVQSRFSSNRIVVQPRFLSLDELLLVMRFSMQIPGSHNDLDRGSIEDYNTAIRNLFDSSEVQTFLNTHLEWAVPMRGFFELLSVYVEQLEHLPNPTSFLRCARDFFVDPLSVTLQSLQPVDIMLLYGMLHLERKGLRQCTFEMICTMWKDAKRKHHVSNTLDFDDAFLIKAFERLIEQDLIVAEGATSGCLQADSLKRFQKVMLRHDGDDLRERFASLKVPYPAWLGQWISTDGIVL